MRKLFFLGVLISFLFGCQEKKTVQVFMEMEHPALNKGAQPFLFGDAESLMMSWTEKLNDSMHAVQFARYDGASWSEKQTLISATDFFVNWADFPAFSKNGERMILHVLQKSDTATFAYDVKYLYSEDGGQTWSDPLKLHRDSTITEHGFVSYAEAQHGGIWASWLDGRNTGGGHGGEGAMQLRAGLVDATGMVVSSYLVDDMTCDCCQTAMAMTADGPLVAYRDRSGSEIRDICTSLFVDGQWTEPVAVANDSWKINGCPVNGPALDAIGNNVALSWFTAAGNNPKVQVAFSNSSGRSFENSLRLDHGNAIGRTDLIMIDKNSALVSWMESAGEEAKLFLALLDTNGSLINEWEVAEMSASRSSGFPRMSKYGSDLFIAWNDRIEREEGIKMVQIRLQDIIP